MMKILITTDFSPNSRKAIHFAMQLATQTSCELIFYNVVEIFRPTIWDHVYYGQYEVNELQRSQKALEQFIHAIYQKSTIQKTAYKCICKVGISASNQIIDYAKEIKADYICISTIGSGKLIQLFGTTASQLVSFCPIPVFIIPKNYKSSIITNICFASDLINLEEELSRVLQFTEQVKAKLSIIHFDYSVRLGANKNKFNKLITKYESDNIKFDFKELNALYPLNKYIQKYILKTKPSLLISFTKQNRNWFDKLFLSSKTADMVFDTKTPILVFRKKLK
ncbi:universal stress protein [Flavobacterium luteum]|uniref:Universal stress protein n=1 Tax=Flavobacterium luteum TaxID=2026654 RepID=A0A7J5AJA2_9FLAO|nr:universal stress protein [Flavobacterium luteum]KAB1157580.1 universal stress protein [Flavobacterium luteum]